MSASNIKHTMFLTEASKRWNATSPEAKQKFFEMAQKQKEVYLKAVKLREAKGLDDEEDGVDPEMGEDEQNQMRSK